MKIVILYDPGAQDWTAQDIAGVMDAVNEIARIFTVMGHETRRVPVRHDLRWFRICRRADLVFNLCEGIHGVAQWEDHVVGSLELAGIPYTGNGPWTLAACRRKSVANAMLAAAGLPVPRWTVAQGRIADDFPLPAIVKPAAEDASTGLDRQSVVVDRRSLRARVAAMTEQFDEVLIQHYIPGREFNVGFVGDRTLPIAEIDFAGMPAGCWPILTYAAKWDVGSPEDVGSRPVCPAEVSRRCADRLCRIAEAAWRIMHGKGYGRVDLRVDQDGRPWVLEVNPNPDLTDDAGLSRMARAAGWDYPELVRRIAEEALRAAQGKRAARELLAHTAPAPLSPSIPSALPTPTASGSRRARTPRTA
ncbi:MAG: D-alanine--D-alanine ligase family protein [Gemmatimonadales bacterium]